MNTRQNCGSLTYKSGSLKYAIHKIANETLEKEGIESAVVCPEDIDPNEWIAVHIIDFYNDINLIFSVVQDECTTYTCPIMSAGSNYEFLWFDKNIYKKPTRLPAKLYIEYLMNWIVRQLEDVRIFPVEPNVPFPVDYRKRVCDIFRRMFRVYAHIHFNHKILIDQLQLSKQFTFSLQHFLCFVNQFNLVNPSDIRPLRELVTQLLPELRLVREMNEAYEKKDHAVQANNRNRHSQFETSNYHIPENKLNFDNLIQDIKVIPPTEQMQSLDKTPANSDNVEKLNDESVLIADEEETDEGETPQVEDDNKCCVVY